MNRRGFLGAILAAGVAPAIVRADSLMHIIPRQTLVHRCADLDLHLICGEIRYDVNELDVLVANS